jgi:replicative DNA helicase
VAPPVLDAAHQPERARGETRPAPGTGLVEGVPEVRLGVGEVARQPERLAEWAKAQGAGTVAIDALKDVAARLSEDETGSGITRAWNHVLAEGIEIVANHHQRKATGENRKPNTLDDVYGSAWITAGAGSVVLLWGKAGDPVVELSQLKHAAGEVGPFKVAIDFTTGGLRVDEGTDPLAVVRAAPNGLTAQEAARILYGSEERSDVEKARRQMNRLERRRLVRRRPGQPVLGQGARQSPDRYVATAPRGLVEGPA